MELKERVYHFSISIIRFLDDITIKRIHNSIADQLLRSSTSVGANIIEAKSASSKRDFIKYYEIALKSANETKYSLCIFRDGLKIDPKLITPLIQEITEISKIIASSVITLKKTSTKK